MNVSELHARLEAELPRLEGWCSAEKARKMVNAIMDCKPNLCVEIGVFGGSSLIPQAVAMKHLGRGKVIGIDPWCREAALEGMQEEVHVQWWSHAVDLDEVYEGCSGHLRRLELLDHCELVRAKSADVVGRFGDGTIGLLHIDGNHSEGSSLGDAASYLPKVAPGGYVFFDDVSWTERSVVTTHKALAHLLENGFGIVDQTGDCVILRKGAPSHDPTACRWRESPRPDSYLCRSDKYIGPPNPVTLTFCGTCAYRSPWAHNETRSNHHAAVFEPLEELLPRVRPTAGLNTRP